MQRATAGCGLAEVVTTTIDHTKRTAKGTTQPQRAILLKMFAA
jgi:hypothetical protein